MMAERLERLRLEAEVRRLRSAVAAAAEDFAEIAAEGGEWSWRAEAWLRIFGRLKDEG
jgi:hypothetical protein